MVKTLLSLLMRASTKLPSTKLCKKEMRRLQLKYIKNIEKGDDVIFMLFTLAEVWGLQSNHDDEYQKLICDAEKMLYWSCQYDKVCSWVLSLNMSNLSLWIVGKPYTKQPVPMAVDICNHLVGRCSRERHFAAETDLMSHCPVERMKTPKKSILTRNLLTPIS